MTEIASAYVSLIPSARGFGRATQAQIAPQMRSSGAASGALFGKSMLKGFIAVGVALKITQFLSDSVGEAREAQKVGALTNNVIKSTGGVAKVSAAQVGRLADALSKKTGIDDEQIQSSENLLLTFKNVIRQGDGLNNIFARATRSAVDLSASGFGSVESTSKQLGKALNDPVKGLTALSRAGVTFTDKQKDTVKSLVETGNTLKAQKLILREVESQTKGAAEAQATGADKARVAWANLKEQIGTALLPVIDRLAVFFTTKIAPAISSFITGMQSGQGAGGRFASFLRTYVLPIFEGLVSFVQNVWLPAFRDALPRVLAGAKDAFNKIRDAVRENKPELLQLWAAAKKIAQVFFTKVVPAVAAFAAVVINRLGTAIAIAIKIAAFLVNAYNRVRGAFNAVSGAVRAAIGAFTAFVAAVRQKVANVITTVQKIPGKIARVFSNALTLLKFAGENIIKGLINGIKAMAKAAADAAVAVVKGAVDKAKGFLHIKSPSKLTYDIGRMVGEGLARGIESTSDRVGQATEKLGKKVKEKVDKLKEQLSSVRSDFASLVEPITSAFTGNLFEAENASGFVSSLMGTKGQLSRLLDAFKTLVKAGLKPGFLYQLFQSGNAGLILDMAANPALAQQAGSLFSDVTSLSDQLGTAVAGATDKGQGLEKQTVRLEHKLDQLIKHVDQSADRTGRAINGAASSGRRRAA